MIFGSYHITVRKLKPEDIPVDVSVPPAINIEQKVNVAHVLFIPLFPIGMVWGFKVEDQIFKLNKEVVDKIEARVGKRKVPWYSFLGLLLVGLFIVGQGFENFLDNRRDAKNYGKQQVAQKQTILNQIDAAAENKIFYFRESSGSEIGLRAISGNDDSIRFEVPVEYKKENWRKANAANAFYLTQDKFVQELSFARADLKKAYNPDRTGQKGSEKLLMDKMLPVKGGLSLVNIKPWIKEGFEIEKPEIRDEVYRAYDDFHKSMMNTDSFTAYLDSASLLYFKRHLENSFYGDERIVEDINGEFYRAGLKGTRQSSMQAAGLLDYQLALTTKYVYNKTITAEERLDFKAEEKLKDYIFFLRLLGSQCLLTIDDEMVKRFEGGKVTLLGLDVARMDFTGTTTMLDTPSDMTYTVYMFKEEGKWKVNVPSSFSYVTQQISVLNRNNLNNRGEGEYRALLRQEYKSLADGTTFHEAWNY